MLCVHGVSTFSGVKASRLLFFDLSETFVELCLEIILVIIKGVVAVRVAVCEGHGVDETVFR